MTSKNNVRGMKTLTQLKATAKARGIRGFSTYTAATKNNLRRRILNNMNNNRGMGGLVQRHPNNAPKSIPNHLLPREKRKKTMTNGKRNMLISFLNQTNNLRNLLNNNANFNENGTFNNLNTNKNRVNYFTGYHQNDFYGRSGEPILLEHGRYTSGIPNFRGNMNNAKALIHEALNHGFIGKNFRLTQKGSNFLRNNRLAGNEIYR